MFKHCEIFQSSFFYRTPQAAPSKLRLISNCFTVSCLILVFKICDDADIKAVDKNA